MEQAVNPEEEQTGITLERGRVFDKGTFLLVKEDFSVSVNTFNTP
jgi:urease accessory protein UreE